MKVKGVEDGGASLRALSKKQRRLLRTRKRYSLPDIPERRQYNTMPVRQVAMPF
jgi:hypothetical protein